MTTMKPFQPSAVAAMIALSRIAASSCLLALLSIAITPTRAGAAQDLILADGFDVDLTTAYFVSPDGVDTNPGTAALPFQTIGKGIAAGFADGLKKNVLVAGGTYGESVALANGVSVFGGYQAGSWVRDTSEYSIIDGIASAGIHKRTVLAANITAATTFDGFVVFGAVNGNGGGNSYGIYVTGSNANLSITNNLIFAGHGGSGADGSAGPAGTAGVDGGGRNPDLATPDPAYDALTATGAGECNVANNRQIANGGALSCGADNVGGGAGGGNQCPVKSGCTAGTASGCSAFTWSEFSALDGAAGKFGGGAGGFGGDDMVLYNATAIPSLLCYLPTDTDGDGNNTFGLDGNSGGNGGNGGGVSGCSVAIGAVAGGHWVGGAGLSGNAGGNGGGGGGGGAGGLRPAGAQIYAHEEVLQRLSAPTGQTPPVPVALWPTDTFFTPKKTLSFNGEAIELLHLPAAHSNGDLLVWFRRSDVIAVGDVYTPDRFPMIDLARGGSVQGMLDALNRIIDITVPRFNQQGGTLVVPGHGRISNESDVVEYRDMATIVRDRIQRMIDQKMTLEQVRAANPVLDYEGVYGRNTTWTTSMFVEAMYRDLNDRKGSTGGKR